MAAAATAIEVDLGADADADEPLAQRNCPADCPANVVIVRLPNMDLC